jgi:deoxyribonuclease-4
MSLRPLFGVAGNPPNYWHSKFSNERARAPEWLSSIGLDTLEIQCTYGVRMPEERARAFHQISLQYGITLSIHGPYYINLGSSEEKK